MLSEKEKLEEELKLLGESFELEVITKEEYEETKQRTEERIKALEEKDTAQEKLDLKEKSKPDEEGKEQIKEEIEEEKKEPVEKEVKEEEVKIEEVKEEDLIKKEEEERIIQEEKESEKELEEEEQKKPEEVKPVEEKAAEKEKVTEESKEEEKAAEEEKAEEVKEEEKKEEPEEKAETAVEEEKKSNIKIYSYILVILVLAFGAYFFFFSGNDVVPTQDVSPIETSFIACSSDDECKQEGSIGTCTNPGTEDSECTYIEDVKVELMVLNSNSCFNCETGRVLSILNNFFPNLDTENIDFDTGEGKAIADKYDIDALPAYILDSNLDKTHDYYMLNNAFTKVGDSFIMKNTVSNANYYIEREEIPNKLDLFLKPGQSASLKAEENLEEFWKAFEGILELEKHNENSKIVKELGINTFPTFLVNNKVKFSGVQAADKIRENFCQLNKLVECDLELSKSLV